MTYEFAKHIADNLRFGSYNGKWEVDRTSVKITDVNSNTYIKLSIGAYYQCVDVPYKKGFKTYYNHVQKEAPSHIVQISTGINTSKYDLTNETWHIHPDNSDYQFWSELYTWLCAKWDDKVYKHKCLIEEVFVL